ncbi:MAG: hypothetical protein HY855_01260 [Burkholderiales bacterium]|nr:hypothetical protein [Burkholderiales bacterium]
MTNPSLTHVTLETLENYRRAATQAVTAYRRGGHRLVGAVDTALQGAVLPRAAKLAPRAIETMDGVRGNVTQFIDKGIDQVADRTEQAIEASNNAAVAQVKKVAQFATGIENPMVVNGLQGAVRFTLPGAQAALAVSAKVVEGATALVEAAGGKPVKQAVRKAVAGTRRTAAKAGATVKAAAKPVRRAVRKTAMVAAEVSPFEAPKKAPRRAAKKAAAA